jgi:ABC-2 type transport system permease protein
MGRITLRQLLGRRRTILLLLLAAIPVLLAIVFRAANDADLEGFASGVLDAVAVTLLLPIVAVLFGTAAFGAEIEDGTILYLLAKPISRWAFRRSASRARKPRVRSWPRCSSGRLVTWRSSSR